MEKPTRHECATCNHSPVCKDSLKTNLDGDCPHYEPEETQTCVSCPPALEEYWKQVGESYRETARLLRADGNNRIELAPKLKQMADLLESGFQLYTKPNAEVSDGD